MNSWSNSTNPKPEMETCDISGKICYDKREAETVRNLRMRPQRGRGKRRRAKVPKFLRIYQCDHCSAWHLTSARNYTPTES